MTTIVPVRVSENQQVQNIMHHSGNIGEPCRCKVCNMLTFTPFHCGDCDQVFCREHIRWDEHSCPNQNKRTSAGIDFDIKKCVKCKKKFGKFRRFECGKCHQIVCIEHRANHNCDPEIGKKILAKRKAKAEAEEARRIAEIEAVEAAKPKVNKTVLIVNLWCMWLNIAKPSKYTIFPVKEFKKWYAERQVEHVKVDEIDAILNEHIRNGGKLKMMSVLPTAGAGGTEGSANGKVVACGIGAHAPIESKKRQPKKEIDITTIDKEQLVVGMWKIWTAKNPGTKDTAAMVKFETWFREKAKGIEITRQEIFGEVVKFLKTKKKGKKKGKKKAAQVAAASTS